MNFNSRHIVMGIVLSTLFSISLYADRGEDVYTNICSKCHQLYVPLEELSKNFEAGNKILNLKAPTISQISYRMKQKIGDPRSDEDIQRMEVSAFIADYIIYPDKQKSVLHPNVGKHFETMPSLKGKLSTDDIEAISGFVYDYDKKVKSNQKIDYVSFENALKRAKKEDKIIIIKATAPHCRYCKKMEENVLVDKDIIDLLDKEFVIVSVDVSKETLPLDLRVSMTPSFFFVFVEKENDKVKIKRIPGAWNKEDFLDILKESILAKKNP